MEKEDRKKKFIEEHPAFGKRDYTRNNYSKLNIEIVKKIIELYPYTKNNDIAEKVGFSENQFSLIVSYLRKAGVNLVKDKVEDSLSYIIKNIVEELNK